MFSTRMCLIGWAVLAGGLAVAAPAAAETAKPDVLRALVPAVSETKWSKGWWMPRHEAKRAEAQAGGAPVVFIGDSITHGWESAGGATWARYFKTGPYRALNLGFSADRTEHVLWRLTKGGALDGFEAKCIVLMIGSNNTGHFSFAEEPPVDTILGVREILRVIAEKQPNARTVLTAIFPRGRDANDPLRRRNDVVNNELAKFADGQRVIWCDFSDKFLAADGQLTPELFPDYLHPNARGYEIWASAVLPLIDRVLAAKPGEPIPSVWPSYPQGYSFVSPAQARPTAMFPKGNWWETRCREKRNEIVANKGAHYDLVMVGDSITHIWERAGGAGCGAYAELKKKYSILNLGYGGDCTQHVIWRLQNGELEGYTTKLFTLMIGTNNARTSKPAHVAAGIRRILDILREKHPEAKVLLMPIFPRNTPADVTRRTNEAVNKLIRPYADGTHVLWFDINDRFAEPSGALKADLYTKDKLHLSAAGYDVWRAALEARLRSELGK